MPLNDTAPGTVLFAVGNLYGAGRKLIARVREEESLMYNQIILLGVVVSMIFTEITGLSAGLIIPGYLVLALHSPGRIFTTLIMASVSVLLCRLASQ